MAVTCGLLAIFISDQSNLFRCFVILLLSIPCFTCTYSVPIHPYVFGLVHPRIIKCVYPWRYTCNKGQSRSMQVKHSQLVMFLVREWEINPRKKIQDPAGIRTQDLLNTNQTLLPLSHLDPWQRSGRQATQAVLSRGLSWIPTDSHSLTRQRCLCSLSSAPLPRVQVA